MAMESDQGAQGVQVVRIIRQHRALGLVGSAVVTVQEQSVSGSQLNLPREGVALARGQGIAGAIARSDKSPPQGRAQSLSASVYPTPTSLQSRSRKLGWRSVALFSASRSFSLSSSRAARAAISRALRELGYLIDTGT